MHILSTATLAFLGPLASHVKHQYIPAPEGAFTRIDVTGSAPTDRVFITTGHHGDEPVGNTAALMLAKQLNLQQPKQDYVILTHLNPIGSDSLTAALPSGENLNHFYAPSKGKYFQNSYVAQLFAQGGFSQHWDFHECHRRDLSDQHLMYKTDAPLFETLIQALAPELTHITWTEFISKHSSSSAYQKLDTIRELAAHHNVPSLLIEHNIPMGDVLANYPARVANYTHLVGLLYREVEALAG